LRSTSPSPSQMDPFGNGMVEAGGWDNKYYSRYLIFDFNKLIKIFNLFTALGLIKHLIIFNIKIIDFIKLIPILTLKGYTPAVLNSKISTEQNLY